MAVAVEFYHQLFASGGEVGDVRADHNLPRKLDTVQTVGAEALPEGLLGGGHLGAVFSGAAEQDRIALHGLFG
jgi:hypothetical protein